MWGHLLRGLERLTELIDPGPVDQEHEHNRTRHRRGAVLWHPHTAARGERLARLYERELLRWERSLARPGDEPGLRLWGRCGLRRWQEAEHMLLLGSTGSGKTTVMVRWLEQVIQRGDRCVVFDPKADLVTWLMHEYEANCVLLAPWDRRSVAWGLSHDIRSILDCDDAARVLVPDVPDARDPYWHLAPQAVVRGALQYLVLRQRQHGRPWSWRDLWSIIAGGPDRALQAIRQTPSGGLVGEIIAGGSSGRRTSARDVWSTIAARLVSLEHLAAAWPSHGEFGVSRWCESEGPRVLVVPILRRYSTLGVTVARLLVETLARHLLSLPDDPDRRVWVFADEFSALGEVPAVGELLLRARSKGGVIVAALQDLGSIRRAWGRDQASSVLNAFGTLVVLRVSDPDLAEWAARALGRREVVELVRSRHTGGSESGSESVGHSEHVREEYVVIPSELQTLPVATGYLRVVGWPVVRLGWLPVDRPHGAPVEVPADWVAGVARPAESAPPPPDEHGGDVEQERER